MAAIRNVAIVGATGNVGEFITQALLQNGKHKVTALSRSAQTIAGVETKTVDYDNQASLVQALRGQDALIITMSTRAPHTQSERLVDAAAEAGVPWIVPDEWGFDHTNDVVSKESLIGGPKLAIRKRIQDAGKSAYIAVVTGFWYEWSLGMGEPSYGFDVANKTATFYDKGTQPLPTSTWPQVGRAVAALLGLEPAKLEKYRNRSAFVASFVISQQQMYESLKRVTGTSDADWKQTYQPSTERYAAGVELMQKGELLGFIRAMYSRGFWLDGSNDFSKLQTLANKELGLPEEDLDAATKRAIGFSESRSVPITDEIWQSLKL